MWPPRLALLLLLRFSGVLLVEGINTCQSINLDKQKSRRIEAVRGQILSKLRIRSPPDEDDEPRPGTVPPEVMLLYNSTRELLKERARLAESACERESSEEDYYAKEVQRIDMLPPRTDTSECVGDAAGGPNTLAINKASFCGSVLRRCLLQSPLTVKTVRKVCLIFVLWQWAGRKRPIECRTIIYHDSVGFPFIYKYAPFI